MRIHCMRRSLISCLAVALAITLGACGQEKRSTMRGLSADLSMYRSIGVVATTTALDEDARKLAAELEASLIKRLESHGQFERVERWSATAEPAPELKLLATLSRIYRPRDADGSNADLRIEAGAEAIDVATGRGYGMVRVTGQGDGSGLFNFGGTGAIDQIVDQLVKEMFAPVPDAE